MKLDLSAFGLRNRAFNEKPMTFLHEDAKRFLSDVIDIIAVETGNKSALEYWQRKQLDNLLSHASTRSEFWRSRIGSQVARKKLRDLPILARQDVSRQVKSEGSLLRAADNIGTKLHATSGSSGTPVTFFFSAMNSRYNQIRSTAEYFMRGLPLDLNRTKLSFSNEHLNDNGLNVKTFETWLPDLNSLFVVGKLKHIKYLNPTKEAIRKELLKDRIGYLNCSPWSVEVFFQHITIAELKASGLVRWIAVSETPGPALREAFERAEIPITTNYSSEEVGLIANECSVHPGYFHVASSNVIVEVLNDNSLVMEGVKLGRVLVTHLHSYATPFIRYEIGDLAQHHHRCPCGREGDTLSHIYGRTRSLISHADGRVSPFYINAAQFPLREKIRQYRIRQTTVTTLVVELEVLTELSDEDKRVLMQHLRSIAGEQFHVDLRIVDHIDWGGSVKRLGFHNEIL